MGTELGIEIPKTGLHLFRHIRKDGAGEPTYEGIIEGRVFGQALADHGIIYVGAKSTGLYRARLGARLVTRKEPEINDKVGFIQITDEEREELREHGKGRGGSSIAIFELDKYRPRLQKAGDALAKLIERTLQELHEGERIGFCSHDAVMSAGLQIFNGESIHPPEKNFEPLEGKMISKGGEIIDFFPKHLRSSGA